MSHVIIEAISRERREAVLEGGHVTPFVALHARDGEEVDEIFEDGFATVQVPGGGWAAVHFDRYPPATYSA